MSAQPNIKLQVALETARGWAATFRELEAWHRGRGNTQEADWFKQRADALEGSASSR